MRNAALPPFMIAYDYADDAGLVTGQVCPVGAGSVP
jgi:hypothetical protein